jgi:hypothetical protein
LGAGETDEKFSYEKYSNVLKTYVDEKGRINYRELKENKEEIKIFLDRLEKMEPEKYQSWSNEEKISFWINAYNAVTLKVILNHYPFVESSFRTRKYPRNSIRQISGVWNKIKFPVMGKAARGCPPLRQEPYKAETLNEQLHDQTRRFISEKNNFLIEKKQHLVYLSGIFKWYGKDFIGHYDPMTGFKKRNRKERAVLNFISLYLKEEDRKFLKRGSYKIKYLNYDWSLNEQEY